MRARLLLVALVAGLVSAPHSVEAQIPTLDRGKALFWTGPKVDRPSGSWTYRFKIEDPGSRLRVGIDHPEVDDDFSLRVSGPVSASAAAGGGIYSGEALIEDPPRGTYTLTVSASDADETNFRVRAKLEARPPSLGTTKGPVLPNLQVLPPHEASFLFPVTNGGFGDPPQGADTQGRESCHPEEHAEDGAVRCLRFAYGVRNTGLGPLQLFHKGGAGGVTTPLFQRVQRADETYFDRAAGLARYHKTHGHWHHDAAIGLQLYKVTDAKKGKLEAASEPRTKGFAHREELLRDWNTFYPVWPRFGIGLSPGWADIYEWDRPGNYIDFGLNADGRYVVRLVADPVEEILESNERDNLGYTYLTIEGAKVTLLEAGRGADPWDPCKIVVGFGGHADPAPK
ncbi:MAG TPA: hypothetical protein VG929_00025, partial [Actinomycetota bacterium]|nr:hypothetical protein [Actinomycetota bacterium]